MSESVTVQAFERSSRGCYILGKGVTFVGGVFEYGAAAVSRWVGELFYWGWFMRERIAVMGVEVII